LRTALTIVLHPEKLPSRSYTKPIEQRTPGRVATIADPGRLVAGTRARFAGPVAGTERANVHPGGQTAPVVMRQGDPETRRHRVDPPARRLALDVPAFLLTDSEWDRTTSGALTIEEVREGVVLQGLMLIPITNCVSPRPAGLTGMATTLATSHSTRAYGYVDYVYPFGGTGTH